MNSNVHRLPVRRKAGRPRLHPAPSVQTGNVLAFPTTGATVDDRIAEYEACIKTASQGLLMAIRAVTDLQRKFPIE